MQQRWITSQLGAREKFAIPRALHSASLLKALITDLWIRPGSVLNTLLPKSASRYHRDLENAEVRAFNFSSLSAKLAEKAFSRQLLVDKFYDAAVANCLNKVREEATHFFSYSYSALQSLRAAKNLQLKSILGQINPGPEEANIVIEEYKKFRNGTEKPFVPTRQYWDDWRKEIDLADTILVNSEWSKKLLVRAGIRESKCVIIPLAFEKQIDFTRSFASGFYAHKPLKLLYLGGLELRKGFHILIDAMRLLERFPVKLEVIGGLKGPKKMLENLPSNVEYRGRVSPGEVDQFYKAADLFMFPTLSDGFGLTQLEAQAYKLPVVTSRFCAPVITHNLNGFVLENVTPKSIVEAIVSVLDHPTVLQSWSENAVDLEEYSISKLSARLKNL